MVLFHILITFFLGENGSRGQIASDGTIEVLVRSPLEERIRGTKIGGNPHEASKFVVKRELAATICCHRGDRVGGQEGKHSILPKPGCLCGDRGNLYSTQKPGLALHAGAYPTSVPTANNAD